MLRVDQNLTSLTQILTELWTFESGEGTAAAILDLKKSHRANFYTPSEKYILDI